MITKAFIVFVTLLLFAACNDSARQDKPNQENPKALEEEESNYSEVSFKRGYADLVESLYSELLSKNSDLKDLEDKIQVLNESKDDSTELFNNFNNKNANYYSAANGHVDQLSDSLLKLKMKTLVSNSLTRYNASIGKHEELLKSIEARNSILADLHVILKIVKTLPLIEKYQKDNLPSLKPIEGFIQKQNQAIKLADTLSKK